MIVAGTYHLISPLRKSPMKFVLPLIAFILLTACASKEPAQDPGPDFHIQQAEQLTAKRQYGRAIEAWEKVRDGFYTPELNTLADMRIADTHFVAGQYVEAAAAYEEFLQQHPKHEQLPRILFQLGMSYHHRILSADRDQSPTRKSLEAFEDLVRRFPGHPLAQEARERIEFGRERLAEHEFYVGRFYLRTRQPEPAIRRFANLLSSYPDYDGRDKVLFHLGEAYLRIGDRGRAKETFAALSSEFPESEFIDKAQKALDRN
jgi:outer membrane protein assembly factor BamD